MSELRDLITVHREIDRLAATDEAIRLEVARFIQVYEDRDVIGWYERYHAMFGRPTPPEAFAPPPIDDALGAMADRIPKGRLLAHRVLLLGVLSLISEDFRRGGPKHDLLLGALRPVTPDFDIDTAEELLRVFHGTMTTLADWPTFTSEAAAIQATSGTFPLHPPPCSASIEVWVGPAPDDDPHGGDQPHVEDRRAVAELVTHFSVPDATDEQIKAFLDPANWVTCSSAWCKMELLPHPTDGGHPVYLEVVSEDCEKSDGPKWAVCLAFAGSAWNGEFGTLEYWMAEDQTLGNGTILDDHGSILVQRLPNTGEVAFASTKSVRFAGPADGPSLRLVTCLFGYGTMAQNFALSCSLDPDWEPPEDPTDPVPLDDHHPHPAPVG